MAESSSGVTKVRREIAIVAGPREWGDTRESWLARVTRRVPTVSFRTVKSLWYGEIQSDDHWAARDIRRVADEIQARKEDLANADRIQSVIQIYRAQDAEFYCSEIARLERVVRRTVGEDQAEG